MPQPYVPVLGVAQVHCRFLLDGQRTENVFNFSIGDADFPVAASQLSALVQNEWWAGVRFQLHPKMVFNEVYIVDRSSKDGPVFSEPVIINPAGVGSGGLLPNNVAFCVTLRTRKRGRSFQGRSYLGGLSEATSEGSYINQDVATAIINAYENLRSVASTSGLPMVVVSTRSGGQPRSVGIQTPVDRCVYNDLVLDSQRRRTPGRGQ